ncbi:MepB family protein [Limibacter armeniacum]|uniref:MepB family protein n=1 Tax=Limibacter armeniacum TaxID=466084 RepID=UPI002FE59F13
MHKTSADTPINNNQLMIKALYQIENTLLNYNGLKIKNVVQDHECQEYFGFNFQINKLNIKFRKAKVTPKKTGLFVSLWKRNATGQTAPFSINDNFDYYIIATEQDHQFGFFLFPKQVLSDNQILTKHNKEGKRGFRVYADWNTPNNKQAQKSKNWQEKYFIDLTNTENKCVEKLNSILPITCL